MNCYSANSILLSKYRLDLQKLVGYAVSDSLLSRVASLAQRLYELQNYHPGNETVSLQEMSNGTTDEVEFGSDLVFRPPARFLIDVSLEDSDFLVEQDDAPSSSHESQYDHGSSNFRESVSGVNFDLSWLRDACDKIVRGNTSQLPRDELAMAICRVLDSEKPGDEVTISHSHFIISAAYFSHTFWRISFVSI